MLCMPRVLSRHLHFPLLHFDKSPNFRVLSIVRIFRELTNKMAFFYQPLFLFSIGPSLLPFIKNSFTAGMVMIGLFYLLMRLSVLLCAIPVGNTIARIGFGRSMVVGNLLYALYAAMLSLGGGSIWMILLAALVGGLELHFFWTAYHSLLSRNMHKTHVGADLSLMQVLVNITALLSPAIGGLVIVMLGYQELFSVGILLALVSVIASFFLDSEPEKDVVSLSELRSWFSKGDFLRESVSFVGKYFGDATLVVWPLYVLLVLGSPDKVGFLYTSSLFLALMVSYIFGSFVDGTSSRRPLYISGGLLSILWIVRTTVLGVWSIAVVDTIDRLVANVHSLYFDRQWMLGGKGGQALSFFSYREVVTSVGALFFWSIFILLFLVFGVAWKGLFVLSAVAVLLTLLMKDKHGSA